MAGRTGSKEKIMIPPRLIVLALFALPTAAAAEVFSEPGFAQRCAADGRRLWGVSLCAPVVVVDPRSGSFRTSEPAPGPLPTVRANTAFDWRGRKWIMLLEPLPADPTERAAILYHEAFHVHQDALGLPAGDTVAGHLDDMMARYLMRLEWRALAAALQSRGRVGRDHVAQALAFRARRLAGRADAAELERRQMRHEGLAAYTGAMLSGAPLRQALAALESVARNPTYGRSFAYASGPAWGMLLDRLRPGWRRALNGGRDLPDMVPLAPGRIAEADRYGGSAILAEESEAASRRARALSLALEATSPRRALTLPLSAMQMNFDPNSVTSAPDGSTLYGRITISDRWGRIQTDGTPLRIAPDYSAAYAAWPLPERALELAEGWSVEPVPEGGARLVPPRP
jgi:hypothetical protein